MLQQQDTFQSVVHDADEDFCLQVYCQEVRIPLTAPSLLAILLFLADRLEKIADGMAMGVPRGTYYRDAAICRKYAIRLFQQGYQPEQLSARTERKLEEAYR
jgi:hypothetical protein